MKTTLKVIGIIVIAIYVIIPETIILAVSLAPSAVLDQVLRNYCHAVGYYTLPGLLLTLLAIVMAWAYDAARGS